MTLAPSGEQRTSLQVAEQIGRFEIRSLIGRGGFGAVYRAYDPHLQRDVALKLLHRTGDDEQDGVRIERFLREGRAAARLQHPHIVPVFDAGQDVESGEYYLAAAFIDGRTLSGKLTEGPLALNRAATVTRQLADALEYAHGKGILHRDVKPENVMLAGDGTPFLMDFGLARVDESDERMTKDGSLMGTPAYMSPEQARGQHQELTGASDQYSLGCVLYKLLSGRTPFKGPWQTQINSHLNAMPAPPSRHHRAIPKDLDTICLKCLSKEPGQRYESCGQLAEDLRRWQEGEPITARPLNVLQQFHRWCRREPVVAGLIAGVLLVFAVGLSVSLWQWQRAEKETAAALEAQQDLEETNEDLSEKQVELIAAREAEARALARTEQILTDTQQRERTALRKLYSSHMLSAFESLDDGVLPRVQDLLGRHGGPDAAWRTFEWNYLSKCVEQQPRMRFAGSAGVTRVSLSADGRRLAMIRGGSSVEVWDTLEKKKLTGLKLSGGAITAVQFHADQSGLLLGTSTGKITYWDLATKLPANSVSAFSRPVLRLAQSASGDRLVACDVGVSVKVLDGRSLEVLHELPAFPSPLRCVAISDDGARVLVGQAARSTFGAARVSLWEVESGKKLLEHQEHVGSISGVAFAKDGAWMVSTGTIDGVLSVWDVPLQRRLRDIRPGRQGSLMGLKVFSQGDADIAACSTVEGTILFWDLESGHRVSALGVEIGDVRNWQASTVRHFDVSQTGDVVAAATRGGCSVLNHSQRGPSVLPGHARDVRAVRISPDGKTVASGSFDHTLRLWDVETRRMQESHDAGYSIECLSFSPDGETIALSLDQGKVLLWNRNSGEFEQIFQANATLDCEFSSDGRWIAIATGDWRKKEASDVVLWNTQQRQVGKRLPGHKAAIEVVEFSPDGRLLASGGNDQTMILWDVETGREVRRFPTPGTGVLAIAFTTDGRRVATGGNDGRVRIWEVESGSELRTLHGHRSQVYDLAFTSGDETLISSGWDSTIRFWDPETGDERGVQTAHHPYVWDLDVSPDGSLLATAGADATVKLWDARPVEENDEQPTVAAQQGSLQTEKESSE